MVGGMVKRNRDIWAIRSQASWKQDEGSTTRQTNLIQNGMVKCPRVPGIS
jgi:hypothetical protein